MNLAHSEHSLTCLWHVGECTHHAIGRNAGLWEHCPLLFTAATAIGGFLCSVTAPSLPTQACPWSFRAGVVLYPLLRILRLCVPPCPYVTYFVASTKSFSPSFSLPPNLKEVRRPFGLWLTSSHWRQQRTLWGKRPPRGSHLPCSSSAPVGAAHRPSGRTCAFHVCRTGPCLVPCRTDQSRFN